MTAARCALGEQMEIQTYSPEMAKIYRSMAQREPYRNRVKLARNAAEVGHGWEDLVTRFNISERDARHIVFGRNE